MATTRASDEIVFTVENSPLLEMPNGQFRDSFMITDRTGDGKGLSAGVVWFSANNTEGHPDTHEFDEVFYILKGEGVFRADGVEHSVKAGDVVYCPAGMEHTYLTGDSPLQLFWCITAAWETMEQSLLDEVKTWRQVDPHSGWHTEI